RDGVDGRVEALDQFAECGAVARLCACDQNEDFVPAHGNTPSIPPRRSLLGVKRESIGRTSRARSRKRQFLYVMQITGCRRSACGGNQPVVSRRISHTAVASLSTASLLV